MVIQSIQSFLGDLVTDEYPKTRKDRIKLYKVICYAGTIMLVWRDNAALLNKINLYDHTATYMCTIYFTFALLCMLLGVMASSFPETAPFAGAVSWNGALQAFIFMIASFHLNLVEFYANVQNLYTSLIISSFMFTIVWYLFTKDSSTVSKR